MVSFQVTHLPLVNVHFSALGEGGRMVIAFPVVNGNPAVTSSTHAPVTFTQGCVINETWKPRYEGEY